MNNQILQNYKDIFGYASLIAETLYFEKDTFREVFLGEGYITVKLLDKFNRNSLDSEEEVYFPISYLSLSIEEIRQKDKEDGDKSKRELEDRENRRNQIRIKNIKEDLSSHFNQSEKLKEEYKELTGEDYTNTTEGV